MKYNFAFLVFLICSQSCFADNVRVNSINYYDKKEVSLNVEVTRVNSSSNAPTVIWLHGCAGLVGNQKQSWVQDLNSWGYNTVVIDAFTARNISSVCKNTFTFPRLQFGYDAYYVAKWIKAQSWGSGKIAVMGHSFGAGAILEMVNQNTLKHEFGDIVISAGVAYYPWCGSMGTQPGVVPVQLHLAGNDEITPPHNCANIAKNEWKELAIVEYYRNASHGFDIPGINLMLQTQMGPKLVRWSATDNDISRKRTRAFLDEKLKL
jgi:dienelactone hydrolase